MASDLLLPLAPEITWWAQPLLSWGDLCIYRVRDDSYWKPATYVFFYLICIEGPLTHGDLENLGIQGGTEVREWTTHKASIIWEGKAFRCLPLSSLSSVIILCPLTHLSFGQCQHLLTGPNTFLLLHRNVLLLVWATLCAHCPLFQSAQFFLSFKSQFKCPVLNQDGRYAACVATSPSVPLASLHNLSFSLSLAKAYLINSSQSNHRNFPDLRHT